MSPNWFMAALVLLTVQPSKQDEPYSFADSTLLPAIRLSWAMKNISESECLSMINHDINTTDPTAANRAFVAGEFHQSSPITICHLYTSYHFKMVFKNLTDSLWISEDQFKTDFLTAYSNSTVYMYPSRGPGANGTEAATTTEPANTTAESPDTTTPEPTATTEEPTTTTEEPTTTTEEPTTTTEELTTTTEELTTTTEVVVEG